jgi:hypothetical protein
LLGNGLIGIQKKRRRLATLARRYRISATMAREREAGACKLGLLTLEAGAQKRGGVQSASAP